MARMCMCGNDVHDGDTARERAALRESPMRVWDQ